MGHSKRYHEAECPTRHPSLGAGTRSKHAIPKAERDPKTHRGTWVIQNATTKRNAQPAIRLEGQGLAQNTPSQRQSEILKRIVGLRPFKALPRSGMPNPQPVLKGRDSLKTRHPKAERDPKTHRGTWVIHNATTKRNAQPAIRPEGQGLAQSTPPRRQSDILQNALQDLGHSKSYHERRE
ncbi:unnamed protein product [Linum trigynum]|uniref:Uncharacterized protein n=1 Tax=Linum trigynum TaxID=586398 RepID=A0AAV2FVC1_9ROSI